MRYKQRKNLSALFLNADATIFDAIAVVDKGGFGVGLVVDSNNKLLGIVNDYDIRRATLTGRHLEKSIKEFINENPFTINVSVDVDEVFSIMQRTSKYQIPVVDDNNTVVDLITISDFIDSIPLAAPHIGKNEWNYVKKCLDTSFVSSVGQYVETFEHSISDYVGSKYAVATNSGTSALHTALLSLRVNPGDEVLVPALSFIAPINAISYCMASPVFIDSDTATLGVSAKSLEEFLDENADLRTDGCSYNKKTNAKIACLIVVHAFGHPVDMDPITELCEKFNISIVEDAAESLGSTYKSRQTGTIGRIGVFSFNGNKIITTGGGGMLVTDDEAIARRAYHLTTQAKSDSLKYEHDEIGYNYRLSNVLAAIGVAQMEQISGYIECKRKIAESYQQLLNDTENCNVFVEQPWAKSNYWLNTIFVPKELKNILIQDLINISVMARPIWELNNRHPMYRKMQCVKLDNARNLHATGINLPSSVNLDRQSIEIICHEIQKTLKNA